MQSKIASIFSSGNSLGVTTSCLSRPRSHRGGYVGCRREMQVEDPLEPTGRTGWEGTAWSESPVLHRQGSLAAHQRGARCLAFCPGWALSPHFSPRWQARPDSGCLCHARERPIPFLHSGTGLPRCFLPLRIIFCLV